MAGSLPLVRNSSAQALYPVTRSVEFLTDIAIALNATEQRFKCRPPLTRFTLTYTRMTTADVTAMQNFFNAQKGGFDHTWSFTLGSTTYSNLTLEDDSFPIQEAASSRTTYSFTLKARQTQNAGQTAGSPGAPYPTLANGLTAQLPYARILRYAVLKNDNPIGPRYSYTWFGGGLTGFPSGALHAWELTYPVLADADLAAIETHFRNQWGRWAGFSFTDPDTGITYPKCRYDTDQLVISHNQPNQSSLKLRIVETN